MINQTMMRQYFPGKDPIGEQLNLGTPEKPDWWRIVGVTGDVKAFGQDQPTHADIYRPFSSNRFRLSHSPAHENRSRGDVKARGAGAMAR